MRESSSSFIHVRTARHMPVCGDAPGQDDDTLHWPSRR